MPRRETIIARSIVYAILRANEDGRTYGTLSLLKRVLRLFSIYWLTFRIVRNDLFKSLRGLWEIKEEDYKSTFRSGPLVPMGDMGYSGSTFFRTSDNHVRANPSTLLVRITDFLESAHKNIGLLLGLAPSHHIVMENILYGHDQQLQSGRKAKWESWDLKPTSYFYPERDIAGGALTSQSTKSKLVDTFEGKIRLSSAQLAEFKAQLQKDTQLLANSNAVDYSLFLVRISADEAPEPESQPALEPGQAGSEPIPPAQPPFSPPGPPTWRTGITSGDGKEVYRAAILDFFWAKHTVHAKAMTGLINAYRIIDDAGPMSITAESKDYRERLYPAWNYLQMNLTQALRPDAFSAADSTYQCPVPRNILATPRRISSTASIGHPAGTAFSFARRTTSAPLRRVFQGRPSTTAPSVGGPRPVPHKQLNELYATPRDPVGSIAPFVGLYRRAPPTPVPGTRCIRFRLRIHFGCRSPAPLGAPTRSAPEHIHRADIRRRVRTLQHVMRHPNVLVLAGDVQRHDAAGIADVGVGATPTSRQLPARCQPRA
ncbi:hypothetical protein DL764_000946 [Monosporascus ibericus]|uniref:PIPK domain-containing protein n=1 Tax=Monosporascus ibericus TaxID=155417 RepID=A0A4Q4TV06_9PEZI|nr:hypothetical protein DL764_000946 [Monosporascus ibericus]